MPQRLTMPSERGECPAVEAEEEELVRALD
jgi:hypothetical protein